jgi:hypothetical protein
MGFAVLAFPFVATQGLRQIRSCATKPALSYSAFKIFVLRLSSKTDTTVEAEGRPESHRLPTAYRTSDLCLTICE